MDELLKELYYYWNISDNPMYKGEHPKCSELQKKVLELFKEMDEEELKALLDGMTDEQLETVNCPLEYIEYIYPWVKEYEQY